LIDLLDKKIAKLKKKKKIIQIILHTIKPQMYVVNWRKLAKLFFGKLF